MSLIFIDVDGYPSAGLGQQKLVSESEDGFRPRELGWLVVSPTGDIESGSIYFFDPPSMPLKRNAKVAGTVGLRSVDCQQVAPAVRVPGRRRSRTAMAASGTAGLRPVDCQQVYETLDIIGLPLEPDEKTFGGELAVRSDKLMQVIGALINSVAAPRAILHKGGCEGSWVIRAGEISRGVYDISNFGCPKVSDLAEIHPDWPTGSACKYHDKKTVHCPSLEVRFLFYWTLLVCNNAKALRDERALLSKNSPKRRPGRQTPSSEKPDSGT